MKELLLIIFLAILVEYIVNIIKPLIPDVNYPIPLILSLIVGIGLALLVQIDILSALGFEPRNIHIGCVVTGLVVAGGASAVHELFAKLRASRDDINCE
ncbi:MAG TPA: hypothetical protein VFC74_06240 [Oscillospiraceae bacterium]|nr:hypothetical protein [Oscillospiraceae bacterium]